jgi:cell division protein FtsI (penicillin-binding protein 3)
LRRLGLCSVVIALVFGALAVRVTQLQVLSGDHYKAMALAQRLRTIPLTAERGSIFDRNGRDLAISVERSTVWADPTLVRDPGVYSAKLAPLVGVPRQTLYDRLADKSHRFVYIARTVDDSVAARVKQLALPGVGFVDEPYRTYPSGSVASTIIGRVGGEGHGLDGLEALYDSRLQGTSGELTVERDQHGHDIPGTQRRRVAAVPGTDMVLTIDQALQYEVENSLVDQVTATSAKGGMAVIVDVKTGDVVAMASVDGAGNGRPAHAALAADGDTNKPLTDLFEPGSTNKLITISTAIEQKKVGPDTMFNVPASISVGAEKSYTDAHRDHTEDRWSTTDILRESSNVGTIMIARSLSDQQLASALRRFGLGQKTAIQFPGQPDGLLLDPSKYYTTGHAASAIGYGVAVTAMQMVDVYGTFANGGVTVPPRLIDATIDAHGVRHDEPRLAGHRVISAATAATMGQMLTQVVTNGTGACASIRGYTVAGKTGTSRKPAPGGGYTSGTMASFVGFAPATNPRFASMIVLDEPQSQYGAVAAAPVFSEVVQDALTRYAVPPNDLGPQPQYDAARARAQHSGSDCNVPHGPALRQVLAEQAQARAAAQSQTQATTTSTTAATGGTTPATTGRTPANGKGSSPAGTAAADNVAADTSRTE